MHWWVGLHQGESCRSPWPGSVWAFKHAFGHAIGALEHNHACINVKCIKVVVPGLFVIAACGRRTAVDSTIDGTSRAADLASGQAEGGM